MTRSTIRWSITSCHVFSIVVSALYAGITTTTVFPAIISPQPWACLSGLLRRIHPDYIPPPGRQPMQHEYDDYWRKVPQSHERVERPQGPSKQHSRGGFQNPHDPGEVVLATG